jgi:hypothetical protein
VFAGYTSLEFAPVRIRPLHEILTVLRTDPAIITNLTKARHRLGDLQHLPEASQA